MPARAIGLAVRYSERLEAKQLGNKTFGTARHITTTLTNCATQPGARTLHPPDMPSTC